ncbi:hypothetical protein INS49_012277 [Diaporthe citri]|uniref:uncharacterized protein n=1 Tax=Diaporthe citri TaxID=83186 RepID=UPI001C7F6C78|nr:uncharacterized protein INS49_012277 [Diaporthe citri]KAG6358758.1 hypothetical protein INS49_012277 [Diaporthe citri]
MDIDLDVSAPEWLAAPKQAFFYQTIVNALQSSRLSDSQAKSRAIENSTIYLCTSVGSRKESQDVMWRFSMVVVAIIWQIPHDHVYQDILTDAVISLCKRTEPNEKFGKGDTFWDDWESLPELLMFITDVRQDPIACFGEQAPREKITNFQRLTSFTARLTGAGYTKWMNWPGNELSHALGATREKGMAFDCGLWIATEWLLRSADAIYIALNEWEGGLEVQDTWKILRPIGSALQKWQAWRQRLVELKENWGEWEFKETTLERIKQAIQEMETVEQRHAKIGEEQNADKCADSAMKVGK